MSGRSTVVEGYVPTIALARSAYVSVELAELSRRGRREPGDLEMLSMEFDRMIVGVERSAAERAWDEGYQEANQDLWRDGGRDGNPYRREETE